MQKEELIAKEALISTAPVQYSISELLQGKWQHTDDTSNYLVFDVNLRKEISVGMDDWDEEEFILSQGCQNKLNSVDPFPIATDWYISCNKSDLCWYIDSISATNLSLEFMGRGNTLNYIRVNQ